MAVPQDTLWEAEPHTLAKHAVLRGYLEAWFPILARWSGRLLYVDGFAGPGRYRGGQEGSPIIALNVASQHRAKLVSELVFIFVEEKEERANHLRNVEIPQLELPAHFKTRVYNDQFSTVLGRMLDRLDEKHSQIAPTFAFVDPFGTTGLPMSLLGRLLRRPQCEALITFMSSQVRRWASILGTQIDELIGIEGASGNIAGAPDPVQKARELYESSLRRHVRYVRFFQLRDERDQPIYDLFFATNHPLGHERMKEAMWKVDASGAFSFSDGIDPNQRVLFSATPGLDLAPHIIETFSGRTVLARDVFEHVQDTAYVAKHAREALQLLERGEVPGTPQVEVAAMKADGKKRTSGFPDATVIHFPDWSRNP